MIMATTAISSLFGLRARHERLPTDEAPSVSSSNNNNTTGDDDNNSIIDDGAGINNTNNNTGNDVPELVGEEVPGAAALRPSTSISTEGDDDLEDVEMGSNNNLDDSLDFEEEDEDAAHLTDTIPRASGRTAGTVTLSELEEERELARRRTSACVLLAVFVLFRLWVEALQNGDVFIMMLCLFGTSWTARLIRHNREREEALDERIRVYLENADPNTTEIDRNDLRFLSFQAQLALAMMESQRQMQQGGYGHPDGHGGSSGLTDDAKNKWEHFAFKEGMENSNGDLNYNHSADLSTSGGSSSGGVGGLMKNKGGYGSVAQKEGGGLEEDGPHCSICLGEYEDGEKLVRLPCGHIYHDDCVSSWTTNHTRCPLCNCDLESVTSSTEHSVPEESIV